MRGSARALNIYQAPKTGLFLLFERDLTFSNSKTSAKAGIIWVCFCTFAIIFR